MTNKKPKICPISGFAKVSFCGFVNGGVCSKTGERCNMHAAPEKKSPQKKEKADA